MEAINFSGSLLNKQRDFLCRLVFGCILLTLIYELFSHALLHQLSSPPLVFPYVDITYILFNLSGLLNFLTANYFVSYCFDVLLFVACIGVLIFPFKRLLIFLFVLLYFFYFLIYSNYGAHHIHSKIGILLIPIPFLFSDKNFIYVWEAMRYFTLFLYADSFLWKLFRKTWEFNKQGILIIKENITPVLYAHPDYKLAGMYNYLFIHPEYADVLFKTGFVIEGLFIVGFFTKKFDKYLIALSILLAFGFLFLSDAFAFELLILDLTLLYNFKRIKK